jgi:hypothetical protein
MLWMDASGGMQLCDGFQTGSCGRRGWREACDVTAQKELRRRRGWIITMLITDGTVRRRDGSL